MKQLQHRHPSEIRAGDRLNHAGAVVIVDGIEETPSSWKISFTYEAARFTSDFFFVSKDARHAFPIRRYEDGPAPLSTSTMNGTTKPTEGFRITVVAQDGHSFTIVSKRPLGEVMADMHNDAERLLAKGMVAR